MDLITVISGDVYMHLSSYDTPSSKVLIKDHIEKNGSPHHFVQEI